LAVLDEHIYIDDGILAASSLARLRAKARLLQAITFPTSVSLPSWF
jgi:hypothetical protein